MRHLDDERLADAAEGRLEGPEASHLEGCGSCQAQVTELRDVLMRVTAIKGPAPSPLFWEHFRSQVSEAVDADPAPARRGAGFGWLTAVSSAMTIALVIVVLMVRSPDVERGHPQEITRSGTPLPADTDDIDADEAWALVRSLADDLEYEDARDAGVAPASGSLDRAALELSPAEQTALIKLLEEEMKRTDS